MINIKNPQYGCFVTVSRVQVRMEGLEPPRLAAPDPKSGAATNYATSGGCQYSGAVITPIRSGRNFRKRRRKFIDYYQIKNSLEFLIDTLS
jgi:hypothetical protein